MKKLKRVLALAVIVILAATYLLCFVFAFMKDERAAGMFRAALGCTVFLPIFFYAVLMVVRLVKPDTPPIDTVIFDVGGVLIHYGWEDVCRKLGFSEEIISRLGDHMVNTPLWDEFDRNVRSKEDVLAEFDRMNPDLIQEMHLMIEHLPEGLIPYDYSYDWLDRLRAGGCRVLFLSNWCESFYTEMKEKGTIELEEHTDGGLWSFEAKQTKPGPEIFKTLIKKYSLDTSRCIFIDDRQINVDTARKLGIGAFVFTGYEDAVKKLASIGIRS